MAAPAPAPVDCSGRGLGTRPEASPPPSLYRSVSSLPLAPSNTSMYEPSPCVDGAPPWLVPVQAQAGAGRSLRHHGHPQERVR